LKKCHAGQRGELWRILKQHAMILHTQATDSLIGHLQVEFASHPGRLKQPIQYSTPTYSLFCDTCIPIPHTCIPFLVRSKITVLSPALKATPACFAVA
jgi:hypothetical protein